MSRLVTKLRDYIRVYGIDGKANLCKRTKRGMRTVERWAEKDCVPPALAYDVALACGCTELEASELARELPETKETA